MAGCHGGHGAAGALARWLGQHCRALPVRGAGVRVLDSPADFHRELVALAGRAERRVFLSALYWGEGPLEQQLVRARSPADALCARCGRW